MTRAALEAEIAATPGVLAVGTASSLGNVGLYTHYELDVLYNRTPDSSLARTLDIFVTDDGGGSEEAFFGRRRLDLFQLRFQDFLANDANSYQIVAVMREREAFSAIRYSGATVDAVFVEWNNGTTSFDVTVVTTGAEILIDLAS